MYCILSYLMLFGVAVASFFDKKVKKMWRGEHEAIKTLRERVAEGDRYVWVHAASLGEFEQGRPLIERIRVEHPEYKILLTFFSPSGYEVRKNYDGADIVVYLPIDTPSNARRFIDAVHPAMAFFIKYEFWYNYLHELHRRGTPVYSVSSIFRPGQIFFRWYGKSYSRVLTFITRFFVQNEESRKLLAAIGITDVDVVGDTRFDRVASIKLQSKELPIVAAFKDNKKTFVAGSSWQPDEDIFIPFFNKRDDWKLIIAPHVISESHLSYILSKIDGKALRYTEVQKLLEKCAGKTALTADDERAALKEVLDGESIEKLLSGANVLIIDCFGLLSSIYHYGDVAYVGGGFGVGIHNVLEAAVWNMPVIFGPNNKHFMEAQELKASEGGHEIADASEFDALMMRFCSDESFLTATGNAAGSYVMSRAGVTDKVVAKVSFGIEAD